MDLILDDRFVVYVRRDDPHQMSPERRERRIHSCSSYAEARKIQKEYRRANQESVIRFEGISGGGD